MNYRIKEVRKENDDRIFYPQYRSCFFWFTFSYLAGYEGYTEDYYFISKDDAEDFITKEKGKKSRNKTVKVYYHEIE